MANFVPHEHSKIKHHSITILPSVIANVIAKSSVLEADDFYGLLLGRVNDSEVVVESFCLCDVNSIVGETELNVCLAVENADLLILNGRADIIPVGIFSTGATLDTKFLAVLNWFRYYSQSSLRGKLIASPILVLFDTKFSINQKLNVRAMIAEDLNTSSILPMGCIEININIGLRNIDYSDCAREILKHEQQKTSKPQDGVISLLDKMTDVLDRASKNQVLKVEEAQFLMQLNDIIHRTSDNKSKERQDSLDLIATANQLVATVSEKGQM